MILEKEIELSGNKYTIRQINIREKAELDNFVKNAVLKDGDTDGYDKFVRNVDQWFFYRACVCGLVPPNDWKIRKINGRDYVEEDELYKIDSSDVVALGMIIYNFCQLSDEDKKKLK